MLNQDVIDDIQQFTLTSNSGKSFLRFVPEFGATPTELQLFINGAELQLFDGFKSAAQIKSNDKSRGIFLIPFPNRIRDGSYVFEGKEYQLPINKPNENNAIHGFIWNRKFEWEENKNAVALTHDYKGDFPGFPFPFLARFEYELADESFSIKIKITNTGKTSMPLGIGWHPYFMLHKKVDELQLQLPACNYLEADERLIPTGKRAAFKERETLQHIGSRKFDDVFECTGNKNFFETKLHDPKTGATIMLQQDGAFKYLQVYTPPERNSIAIEPMTCPANAFNTGEGLITLKSGESFEGMMSLKFEV
ncbi:MAG: hypothetical protein SH857_12235 [Chitinophagales bacterium]|nr:hypothetical protein [Chitinophagales bacterium]